MVRLHKEERVCLPTLETARPYVFLLPWERRSEAKVTRRVCGGWRGEGKCSCGLEGVGGDGCGDGNCIGEFFRVKDPDSSPVGHSAACPSAIRQLAKKFYAPI